jgi:parallel beta-helix repeat protein
MGSNNLVDGIEVYNIPYYGIHNYDSSPAPSGNVYRNSVFHDTSLQHATGAAILLANGDSNVADNNTIYNNFGRGIETSYGASNTQISNNHIYQNGTYGILVASVNGSINTMVSNNIVTDNRVGQILDQGTGTALINNRTS